MTTGLHSIMDLSLNLERLDAMQCILFVFFFSKWYQHVHAIQNWELCTRGFSMNFKNSLIVTCVKNKSAINLHSLVRKENMPLYFLGLGTVNPFGSIQCGY